MTTGGASWAALQRRCTGCEEWGHREENGGHPRPRVVPVAHLNASALYTPPRSYGPSRLL